MDDGDSCMNALNYMNCVLKHEQGSTFQVVYMETRLSVMDHMINPKQWVRKCFQTGNNDQLCPLVKIPINLHRIKICKIP